MSRKLDAAIVNQLGYSVVWQRRFDVEEPYCAIIQRDKAMKYVYEFEGLGAVPYYSTDGNAMLELDSEMRKRGWQIDNLYCRNNVCPGITSFSCAYSKKNKHGEREFARGERVDNEPLARALAAYKALADEEWDEE